MEFTPSLTVWAGASALEIIGIQHLTRALQTYPLVASEPTSIPVRTAAAWRSFGPAVCVGADLYTSAYGGSCYYCGFCSCCMYCPKPGNGCGQVYPICNNGAT